MGHCWNNIEGNLEVLEEKPVPVPLYRTRESAMKGWRLTALEMTQPYIRGTSRRSVPYISPLIFPTARIKFVEVVWQNFIRKLSAC
jgi:hypothetical protein